MACGTSFYGERQALNERGKIEGSPMHKVVLCCRIVEAEGYLTKLLALLVAMLRLVYVEWMDANKPRHFARLMFAKPVGTR